MHLFKFSLIISLFSLSAFALNDNECLKSNFEVEVSHKGQPFGLLPVKLTVNKKECILNIAHEKLRVFKKNWEVDVCREPVHIKSGRGAVEVLKKLGSCDSKDNTSFCSEQRNLFQVIQDDGLIFAPGEKENLATDHGKVYCSYLLVKKYLQDSLVFNRGQNYKGVLSGEQSAPIKSVSEEEVEATSEAPRPMIVGEDPNAQEQESSSEESNPAPAPQEKEGTGSF